MESKINYIRNLVYLGLVDNEFHEKEKEFIRNVGTRLGLNAYVIENEINSGINEKPLPPEEATLRFILLDDLINLMASDGKIQDEEIELCEKYASEFGFNTDVVKTISEKIKEHISEGYSANSIEIFIKKELVKSTSQNYYNEK